MTPLDLPAMKTRAEHVVRIAAESKTVAVVMYEPVTVTLAEHVLALVAALEAAEDELRELASMTADDINAEVWKDKVAAESERNQQADRAARLLARAEAAEADLAAVRAELEAMARLDEVRLP